MKIVIVGDGKVGYTLTKELANAGHDVVVVDKNFTVLQELQETVDVLVVNGNGASLEVQRQAKVAESDLLVAATSADEINLLCCVLAKKLGCPNTVARMRNPEYNAQVRFLREELGLSMTINPERSAAREMLRMIQLPSFLKRDSFAAGRVELVEIKIKEDSKLAGVRLSRFYEIATDKVSVCAVERDGKVTIPSGNFQIQKGDKITVAAATNDLAKLIKNLKIFTQKIHEVMIIGGSRIAVYLAIRLIGAGIDVKIIEKDEKRCEILADLLHDAIIIYGDGTDQALLLSEGIDQMDAVVTLTGLDEENVMVSMYADYLGVPKTITKINRVEYVPMLNEKGIGSVVSPKLLTVNEILRYVRALSNTHVEDSVLSLHRIVGEQAEALEFRVSASMKYLGVPLRELRVRDNVLVACITRGDEIIIPRGHHAMELEDIVVVVAAADLAINDLNDIFERQV